MITLVDNGVYRSPRPTADGFDYIKGTFASVISLEGLEEDAREADELSPVRVFSFPIGFFEIYMLGISGEELDSIVDSIIAAPKPVLVHCQHGQDRTGLAIAAYRVSVQGWTKDRAMQEARVFGYRYWLNYGLNRTWREWDAPTRRIS